MINTLRSCQTGHNPYFVEITLPACEILLTLIDKLNKSQTRATGILLIGFLLVSLLLLSSRPACAENNGTYRNKPKIGLALGGGGTRGCAHIGVLKVLEREGIPIDCIAGTSIGAIVGGLYAAGLSPDDIEKMICSKRLLHAYDTVPIPVRIAVIPIFFIPHILGHHPYDGLYRGNKFAHFITNSVPKDKRNVEDAKIPFRAVAANLLDGKAYAISTGDIGRAIQASSAIPFLRRPVDWQGKLFIDGGIVVNLPCEQTRELGADYVIAVDIDDDLQELNKKHFHKIGSVTTRAINMHLSAVDSWQTNKADIVIHPDVSGIHLLSRNIKDVTIAVKAGEEAAQKIVPLIREQLKNNVTISDRITTKSRPIMNNDTPKD